LHTFFDHAPAGPGFGFRESPFRPQMRGTSARVELGLGNAREPEPQRYEAANAEK
jgi:hypothetical protein